ncbi:MAG: FeoB-associated Cys-rich membrane protein [Bacteroidota bacterium]
MIQEIITYIIIAVAAALTIRKFYQKMKQPSSCDGCSTDSCAACGLADLKKDMKKAEKHGEPPLSPRQYPSS